MQALGLAPLSHPGRSPPLAPPPPTVSGWCDSAAGSVESASIAPPPPRPTQSPDAPPIPPLPQPRPAGRRRQAGRARLGGRGRQHGRRVGGGKDGGEREWGGRRGGKRAPHPLSTPVPSVQLYALLEDRVSRPGFEAALADARRTAAAGKPAPAADGAPPPAVLNIGARPTVADGGGAVSVEVHIMHTYAADFYGRRLAVAAGGFIRPELRFDGVRPLVARIRADLAAARVALESGAHDGLLGEGVLREGGEGV